MRRLSRGLLPALLLSTTVLVTACAATSRPAVLPAVRPSVTPTAQSSGRQAIEQQGAVALLASLPLPRGAQRLSAAPQGAQSGLPDDPVVLAPGHGSVATGWWRSPLGLAATQAWVSGLLRKGFTESGTGANFRMAGRDWPQSSGWGTRTAQIAAFASGGTVYLEAVAEAEYVGDRPAASLVPQGSTAVGVRTTTQQGTTRSRVTDPARIRRAAALLNALPLSSTAVIHCPVSTGGVTGLDFGAGHRAELALSGCRGITVFGPGLSAQGIALSRDDDGAAAVLKALGLPA